MKNLITKSAFVLAFIGASFSIASESFLDEETNREYRIISPMELSEADIIQFCKGKMEGAVLSIEGTTLLVDVELNSNLFEGQNHTPRKFKVLKPCFVKCEKGVHFFSSDFKTWKNFKEFFHSKLNISVDVHPESSLLNFTLHLDLHQKEE